MSGPPLKVLIVGVSTRAAAASAAAAGFAPVTVDAFADLDQDPRVRALILEDYAPSRAVDAASHLSVTAAAYVSGFENHPDQVDRLSRERTLWGNPADVLGRARDPFLLREAFRTAGLPAPRVRRSAPEDLEGLWVSKPRAAGGGHGVHLWDGGEPGLGTYLQEHIAGTSGSVAFVAARGRAVPLGVTRQLIGDGAFGASGFQYCGSILPAEGERLFPGLGDQAFRLASAASAAFGLVGINGIDFVYRAPDAGADAIAWPVELNPRWSASVELFEQASGIPAFGLHADACRDGRLPPPRSGVSAQAIGKAVVFARTDIRVGDTRGWLTRAGTFRDVPRPDTVIAAGRPVCTVVATAPDSSGCYSRLVEAATGLYREMDAWEARSSLSMPPGARGVSTG